MSGTRRSSIASRAFTLKSVSILAALALGAALGIGIGPAAAVTRAAVTRAATTPLAYAALGDSYASGPDIPTQMNDPSGCARSTNNYAHVIARDLGLTLTDATCSGATTTDFTGSQSTSTGTNPPQLDAVTSNDSVVTATVGGDNLGFTSIIEHCVAATPDGPPIEGVVDHYFNCKNYYDPTGTAAGTQLSAKITAIAPKIAGVLQDIHARAPHASVYLIGYPDIVPPPPSTGCWPTLPFTTTDAPYLRSIEIDLDQMLASTAAANGATYIDTYTASEPYNSCTGSSTRWISPIIPATAASYPVHPNKAGEAGMAGIAEPIIKAHLPTATGTTITGTPTGTGSTAHTEGYWLVGADGGIFTFGAAHFYGSTGSMHLQRPVVGITPTATDQGYWLVAADGGIFSFGDASFFGSIPGFHIGPAGTPGPGKHLNAPIIGMVPSVGGGGYYMVASDGGVFAFGDAHFAGSCPALPHGCDAPAIAAVPDATGQGYWVVTSIGSVYAFGDARFAGSVSSAPSPIVDAVRTPNGGGYWILDASGNVYAFGDARNFGGLPAGTTSQSDPASSIMATVDGGGYWVVMADGAVWSFGNATYQGGMAGKALNAPIIASSGW
ncbi:MAG: SGNH/GDSL hydrolase family protein [Actinomycetota bacterium]|jgi:hypothetical protein|nr:SGNH/GDSL hydrolase family protein [Actinomycetota bacterium]